MVDLAHIHPVTDFVRNYKTFLSRIKETGKPEVLTVNGKPEYVVLDVSSYQAIEEELERARFVAVVNRGIDDMNEGRGKPVDEAFAEVRKTLGL